MKQQKNIRFSSTIAPIAINNTPLKSTNVCRKEYTNINKTETEIQNKGNWYYSLILFNNFMGIPFKKKINKNFELYTTQEGGWLHWSAKQAIYVDQKVFFGLQGSDLKN